MKDKLECQLSVAAAISALTDDVQCNTPEDLRRLMTLTLSTISDGLVAALGHQAASDMFRFALQGCLQSRVLFGVSSHDGGKLQ